MIYNKLHNYKLQIDQRTRGFSVSVSSGLNTLEKLFKVFCFIDHIVSVENHRKKNPRILNFKNHIHILKSTEKNRSIEKKTPNIIPNSLPFILSIADLVHLIPQGLSSTIEFNCNIRCFIDFELLFFNFG